MADTTDLCTIPDYAGGEWRASTFGRDLISDELAQAENDVSHCRSGLHAQAQLATYRIASEPVANVGQVERPGERVVDGQDLVAGFDSGIVRRASRNDVGDAEVGAILTQPDALRVTCTKMRPSTNVKGTDVDDRGESNARRALSAA